jgi:alpha-tubulin suppressor-like RCC1 family protein
VRSDHRLFCWGDDEAGQLGEGAGIQDRAAPRQVAGGATNWTAVSAGLFHTCGLRSTGRLFCWGNDAYGQLGDGGGPTNRLTPRPVDPEILFRSVEVGDTHTCAIRRVGTLSCWGDDSAGQLGNGPSYGSVASPSFALAGPWASVGAGSLHTCGVTTDRRLFCWGDDSVGQQANGPSDLPKQAPFMVPYNAAWTGVSAGAGHTCAGWSGGGLMCWGGDGDGQVGNGTPLEMQIYPAQIGAGSVWTSVSAGGAHTCGRLASGRLRCWGDNDLGQVGRGSASPSQPSPVGVVAPGSRPG